MQLPDLQALQQGDAAAWDMAFPWLWPAAFGAAQVTLQPYLPAEVEDVAIESLEAVVEKVRELKSVEELKPLVASIAHHRAVSLLRERFAKKRGEGRTESLEAGQEAAVMDCPDPTADSPLAALEQEGAGGTPVQDALGTQATAGSSFEGLLPRWVELRGNRPETQHPHRQCGGLSQTRPGDVAPDLGPARRKLKDANAFLR